MGTTANRAYPYPGAGDNVRPYEDIQALADALDAEVDTLLDAWTSYTPAFTADGGSPTLGTGGTLVGRYKQTGKIVQVSALLTFGTTANGGTGGWYISVPVAARTGLEYHGRASYRDVSIGGGGYWEGLAVIATATNASRVRLQSAFDHAQVTGAVPFAWTTSDTVGFTIAYEAA